MGLLPPPEDRGEDYDGGIPIGRAPAPTGDGGDGAAEDLSPLGAALIEALREAGEDPSDLIRKRESE